MATEASMNGKTVVITGATSGLGAVAAEVLAARGARIVLIARDRARADGALERIRHCNPHVEHSLHLADLSRLAEMKRVAAEIAGAEPRIDVLANNAGAIFGSLGFTPDGLERTFALNHMAYFVLTLGLREPLAAAGGARVVNTASAAHRGASFDPADPQGLQRYNGPKAYGKSKLDNILFTRELARRWRPLGITANCFHPGFVATRFGDNAGWMRPAIGFLKLFAISPEKGAATLIHLAAAPELAGISGEYFYNCAVTAPRPPARDDRAAAALWTESLRLAGLPGDQAGGPPDKADIAAATREG